MTLCNTCQELCRDFNNGSGDWESVEEGFLIVDPIPMHQSWESFSKSLNDNCPICWGLWRSIRSSPRASPNEEPDMDFKSWLHEGAFSVETLTFTLHINLTGKGNRRESNEFHVRYTASETLLEARHHYGIDVDQTPRSVARFVQHWSNHCTETHPGCTKRDVSSTTTTSIALPTRLLDLGDTDSKKFRIVQSQKCCQKNDQYVTLTHRWSHDTPKLLQTNCEQYYTFQSDNMLPQDYQDIISICRAMSVQFLWIDSLCILQDSPEDLLREIKTMLNVYQNALLTLSICWDYSDSTIFPSRRGDTLSIVPPNDESKNIAYSTTGCAFVNHVDEFKINVTHSLVNSRGWVLQERTLSRRIVYLGNEQLYWECDGAIASETMSNILQDKDVRRMPLFHDSDDFRNALWPKLVEKYSQCGLTSESDRLAAISGISRMMSAANPRDRYIAGIWSEYWLFDLLWTPLVKNFWPRNGALLRTCAVRTIEPTQEAPSWSWMAFPGPVEQPRSLERPKCITGTTMSSDKSLFLPRALAMLRQFDVNPPPGADNFDSMSHATLRLNCFLIPADFAGIAEICLNESAPTFYHPISCNAFYFPQQRKNAIYHLEFLKSSSRALPGLQKLTPITLCFNKPWNSDFPTSMIPIFHLPKHPDKRWTRDRVGGLIVQRTSARGQDLEYTRIGTFQEETTKEAVLLAALRTTICKGIIELSNETTKSGRTGEEKNFEARLCEYINAPRTGRSTEDTSQGLAEGPSQLFFPRAEWANILLG
ncbi:unnamed protein product [Clonostachys rhizophaga]|uniref:Heterokaryon incompatibility domain-containing protein n=1 Tax=Clonostachys rhizophaga TaxID=160324 RepID=A0A9N9YII0_9HYPO|nr:unnamed protein product [Clonostachys rhizophaga]